MSHVKHTIKATLSPNALKNAKGGYLPRTLMQKSLSMEEISQAVKEKYGLANADSNLYHVKIFLETMTELVEDGFRVNTGFFTAQAHVKGSFEHGSQDFDPQQHAVEIVYGTGEISRRRAKLLHATILSETPPSNCIRSVTNMNLKQPAQALIANHCYLIKGENIKLLGSDPSVGVYLVHAESGHTTAIEQNQLLRNTHSYIMFAAPQLALGNYELLICTQYAGKSTPLTQARKLYFEHLLTVS